MPKDFWSLLMKTEGRLGDGRGAIRVMAGRVKNWVGLHVKVQLSLGHGWSGVVV